MKRMHIGSTKRYVARSKFKSSESPDDVLHLITGIPAREFLKTYAGREVVVTHGTPQRFNGLLGAAFIPSVQALGDLIPDYSQEIRRVVYDKQRVFKYKTLAEGDNVVGETETCFFFWDFDGHFQGPRLLLDSLCSVFSYTRNGANVRGSFQTPGAFVPRHCDEVDVVILQIFGSRRWRLEANCDPPVGIEEPVRKPERLNNGWSSTFGQSSRVVVLHPGSALYLPRGWWHETRSSVNSFALTIGLVGNAESKRP